MFLQLVASCGAKPHGREDEVLSPNKPVSALPASNWEPTLSVRVARRVCVALCRLLPTAYCLLPNYPFPFFSVIHYHEKLYSTTISRRQRRACCRGNRCYARQDFSPKCQRPRQHGGYRLRRSRRSGHERF